MLSLRQIEEQVITNGRVDGHELKMLREVLYADGKIDRQEAEFLVELYKRVRFRTRNFKQFFYNAIKDHILVDGRIGSEEAAWLREMIVADDRFDEEKYKFLHQLRGEIKQSSPELYALLEGSREEPP
jgi:uncharacterized tellurite resistance protein B-like protein